MSIYQGSRRYREAVERFVEATGIVPLLKACMEWMDAALDRLPVNKDFLVSVLIPSFGYGLFALGLAFALVAAGMFEGGWQ